MCVLNKTITQNDNDPYKNDRPSNKTPLSGVGSLPLTYWLRRSKRLLKQYKLLLFLLDASQKLKVGPYC